MAHFTRASSETDEGEKKEKWEIRVKGGSKIRNIISQALRLLQKEEKIVLTGSGPTVSRTITCAEIVKRKVKDLHQNNKLFYSRTVDICEPKEDQQLDKLQVTRKVPSISITLSTVPLTTTEPGYQVPGQSSPVRFGKEDMALAREDERNEWRAHKAQQGRCSGEEKEHRDGRQGRSGYKAERSQGHNNSRQQKKGHTSDRHRGDAVEDGSQAKNSDRSPGSAGKTSTKRSGYHGGSNARHYSHYKKQRAEASSATRIASTTSPPTETPPL